MSMIFGGGIDVGEITAETQEGAVSGLTLGAEHVLQVSNKNVPIEEATLERSGSTDVDADKLLAGVGYDTPYAIRQHEELEYEHDAGRTAKYLENALNSERGVVLALVQRQIKQALGM